MKQFREGDFILLKNTSAYVTDDSFCKNRIIFEIQTISNGLANVLFCNKMVPLSDLIPIPISKDYGSIHYLNGRIPMASLIEEGGIKPNIGIKDVRYLEDDEIQEILTSNNFDYVHELQHFLVDNDLGELRIDF